MAKAYSLIENILFPPTYLDEKRCLSHFSGKRVIITGASFGIGEQLAYILGSFGAELTLLARTQEQLEAVQQSILSAGGSATYYALDLRDENAVSNWLELFKKENTKTDYLIHCAGLSIRRSFTDSMDRFHDAKRTMAINYLAPVQLTLALFPELEKTSGQIIYLSAINTLFPAFPKWAVYQASKCGFNQWLQSVGTEMKKKQVAPTLIYFPLVRTRMIIPTQKYAHVAAMNPEHAAQWIVKAMLSRKRTLKPWWTNFAVFGTRLFKSTIRSVMQKQA